MGDVVLESPFEPEWLMGDMDAIPEEIVAQYRTVEKGETAYLHQK